MYFGFSDQDEAIRDAVRGILAAACPPSVIREAWEAPPGKLDRTVWTQLSEMGVPWLIVPEQAGGLGLDERSIVLVLEELGAAGVPLPIVESTMVAATIIETDLLGSLFASDLGGGHVPAAADADWLLLGDADGSVHLVDPQRAVIEPVSSTDGARRLGTVRWSPARSVQRFADPLAIVRANVRGRFGTAALLVGLARRMLDMTTQYVTGRQQFGVPVGSFQAVKHHLADARMALDFARPAVYRLAWSLAVEHPDVAQHAALAKLLANRAAHLTGRAALQCHGAIGYTVEYDLHLFMKRAWALANAWGGVAPLQAELAQGIGLIGA